MKKSLVLVVLSLFLFSLFSTPTVLAQSRTSPSPTPIKSEQTPPDTQPTNGLNLTLSPTYISLTTDPGKEVSSQFKVTNNNNFTEYLQVGLAKLQVGADGKPLLSDVKPEDEFATWLSVPEEQFTIGPNQTKTVKFTIDPPASASLGYYYTLLVSRMRSTSGETGSQAVISGSAGITVLLEVRSPNAKKELQVASFTSGKMFYEYLPTTLTVNVKNTGNVHVVPFGDIFIDSLVNKKVAVLHVNPGLGNVLPQSQRSFDVIWDDAFAVRVPKTENGVVVKDDKGKDVVTTKYDFTKANEFRVGKYTAHLLMVYDNGERDIPIQATVSFWVIPWKILGVVLVIGLFALLGIKNTFFSYGKKLFGKKERR